MILKELKDWAKSAKCIDSIIDYDSNGNCYNNQYSIEYCNDHPYGDNGYFNPSKVIKKVKIVEQIDWVFEEE